MFESGVVVVKEFAIAGYWMCYIPSRRIAMPWLRDLVYKLRTGGPAR